MKKYFSELNEAEIDMMIEQCEMAAVKYAVEIHMAGGLSTGSYNVYKAIEDAIRGEYAKAKTRGKRIYQRCPTDGGPMFWDSFLHRNCVEIDPGAQNDFTTGLDMQ